MRRAQPAVRRVDLGLEVVEHLPLRLELAVDRHADAAEARDGLLDVAQLLVLLPVVVWFCFWLWSVMMNGGNKHPLSLSLTHTT